MRGRDSLNDHALWRWADEGVQWLNAQFPDKGLGFSTSVDTEKREVLLEVWQQPKKGRATKIFSVVESIEGFVSPTTVTKILLIAG